MNQKDSKNNLVAELVKTQFVLERLLAQIVSIDEHLKPLEQELQKMEFTSRGAFVRRNPNFILCLPTSSSIDYNNDVSIREIIENAVPKPSVICIDDSSESMYTCQRIAKLIETQFMNTTMKRMIIINLRWIKMIQPFETSPTLIVGKRYILDNEKQLTQLASSLKKIGLQVFCDYGEFGGGPLVDTLLKTLQPPVGSIIVELTMSQSTIKNTSYVNAILGSFSSLWM